MTPCSLVDCTMALVNVIHIESFQSLRCHTSEHQSTFQFPVAPTAVSVRLQRCYDYTLSGEAEEVAAQSRRSTDFALTSVGAWNECDIHFVRHLVRCAAWENWLRYCFGQMLYMGGTSCAEGVCRPLFYNVLCRSQIVEAVRCRIWREKTNKMQQLDVYY